jgi:hypothetical protein
LESSPTVEEKARTILDTVESKNVKHGGRKRRKKRVKKRVIAENGKDTHQPIVLETNEDEVDEEGQVDNVAKEEMASGTDSSSSNDTGSTTAFAAATATITTNGDVYEANHEKEEDNMVHTVDSSVEMMQRNSEEIEDPKIPSLEEQKTDDVEIIEEEGLKTVQLPNSTLGQNQKEQNDKELDHSEPKELFTQKETPIDDVSIGDDDHNNNESEEEDQVNDEMSIMDDVEVGAGDGESSASLVDGNVGSLDDDVQTSQNDKNLGQTESVNVINEGILILQDAAKIIEMERYEAAMDNIVGNSVVDQNSTNILEEGTHGMFGKMDAERSVSFDMMNDGTIVVENPAEMLQKDQDDEIMGGNTEGLVLEDAAQIIQAELENEEIKISDESPSTPVGIIEVTESNGEDEKEIIPDNSIDEEEVVQNSQAQSSNVTMASETDEETEGFNDVEWDQETMDDFSTLKEPSSSEETKEASFAMSEVEHQEVEVSGDADNTERSADDHFKSIGNEDSESEDSDYDQNDDSEISERTASSQQMIDDESNNDENVTCPSVESNVGKEDSNDSDIETSDDDENDASGISERIASSQQITDEETNDDGNVVISPIESNISIDKEDSEIDSDNEDSDDDQNDGDSIATTSSQPKVSDESDGDDDVGSPPVESKTSGSVSQDVSSDTSTSSISIENSNKVSEEILVTSRSLALDTDSIPDSEITCSVVTWNLAESSPSESDAAFMRGFRKARGSGSDFVLFGGQETENTKPRRTEGSRSRELRRILIKMLGKSYVPLALHSLGGVQFALFCKSNMVDQLEHVSIADVACGIGNVFHNKGAIGAFVKMKAQNVGPGGKDLTNREKSVKMLFVACHLVRTVWSSLNAQSSLSLLCAYIFPYFRLLM